jgi:hypothetical protein
LQLRKKQKKLLKLPKRLNPRLKSMQLRREKELPRPRLRKIDSSKRLSNKQNMSSSNKDLLKRKLLIKPNKMLKTQLREENKLKSLLPL